MEKSYRGLWTLLLLGCLAGAAMTLHQRRPWPFLASSEIPTVSAEPPATPQSRQKATPKPKPAPATKSPIQNCTILLIGDSMLEGISPRLAAYAAANSDTLRTVIWYGSTTKQWGGCEKLAELVKQYRPRFVFISLGANEMFIPHPEQNLQVVRSILRQLGSTPYLWIGPPNWKKDSGINNLLESTLPRGNFFRSEHLKLDRAADHVHPTREAAISWTDTVIAHKLPQAFPNRPTQRSAKAASVSIVPRS